MKTGRNNNQTPETTTSSTYLDAINYLYNRINFEKSQDQPYNQQNFRLSRMERLLVQIGNPQQASPIIHIAGSKGKGSVAWLTAEVLRRSGYRTGLYTSPHLVSLEERFVIDGKSISQEDLVRAIQAIAPAVDEIARLGHGQATFFEITTAIAWWLFRESKCDVVVIEVGLGGRLDSTNVCWPTLSIITSISYDHQLQLGNSLAEIASEKAGIIKPGVPVISGVLPDEPREVIHRIAKERGCQLRQAGRDFFSSRSLESLSSKSEKCSGSLIDYAASDAYWGTGTKHEKVILRMLGEHQIANCGLVLASMDLLREQGWTIANKAIFQALAETQVPGRIQVVSDSPLVILDTAHNEASIAALITAIKTQFSDRKLRFIFAASKDKKYRSMIKQLLEVGSQIVVTQFQHNPRTVSVDELLTLLPSVVAELHSEKSTLSSSCPSPCDSYKGFKLPGEALGYVIDNLKSDELLCITGSFFLAAESIPWLRACKKLNFYAHDS